MCIYYSDIQLIYPSTLGGMSSVSQPSNFLYVSHKDELHTGRKFRKVMVNPNGTVADLLINVFNIYNIPFSHLKVYYNDIRIDKKKHSLKLKKVVFDKKFIFGTIDNNTNTMTRDSGGINLKASCLEIQSFFDLDAYLPGGKAYPYVGSNGEILTKPDPKKMPNCFRRYMEASKKSISVRIIMWMWAKSYLTRLILIISILFLFQSMFTYDRNFRFNSAGDL